MTGFARLERDGRVVHLVLDAPPGNPLDAACLAAIARLIRGELPALDPEAVVVRGAGRHFSSGADVTELGRLLSAPSRAARLVEDHGAVLRAIEDLSCPTVAAISGACLGAALELALACRLRVAAHRATFSLPEVTFGLVPGLGGVTRLSLLVGRARAAELALSGRGCSAEEALALGLVDAVVPRDELVRTARDLAAAAASRAAAGAP